MKGQKENSVVSRGKKQTTKKLMLIGQRKERSCLISIFHWGECEILYNYKTLKWSKMGKIGKSQLLNLEDAVVAYFWEKKIWEFISHFYKCIVNLKTMAVWFTSVETGTLRWITH